MNSPEMLNKITVQDRITKMSRWATAIAWFGLSMFFLINLVGFFSPLWFRELYSSQISEFFLDNKSVGPFSSFQLIVSAVLQLITDLPGIIGLYVAIQMFVHFRGGRVFTSHTARALRTIGWCVVAIVPINELCETVGIWYFTAITTPGSVKIEISFGNEFFYAPVFGLVFVMIGHIMVEAANISDENKRFI